MKRIACLLLSVLALLSLTACAGGSANGENGGSAAEDSGVFKVGFGMTDITPKDPVPMASYSVFRMSEGLHSYLEARAVAIQDANGEMLIFAVGDVSWCPSKLGSTIKEEMSAELGIPETHFILSGTHTHASVDTDNTEYSSVVEYNKRYIAGMEEAIRLAVQDLKPARAYQGSVQTEGLNFVRRYVMDDGSISTDASEGTGTALVSHETEVDGELQLLKFVREGGKDIMIANFQCHPHLEGMTNNISSQVVGAFRDAVEKDMDVHCLYWQGASGNINSRSRIGGEQRTSDRMEWGNILKNYAKDAYDNLATVATGPVKVTEVTYAGKINHSNDHMLEQAMDVRAYFDQGHSSSETQQYGREKYGINSIQHARRIIANASLPESQDMLLAAWSFGEIGGVVLPYELFDVSGMQIKQQSPFERTFIVGYSYPSYTGYIPAEYAYDSGGYEVDNCAYAKGTAEGMVAEYLKMLNQMHD